MVWDYLWFDVNLFLFMTVPIDFAGHMYYAIGKLAGWA